MAEKEIFCSFIIIIVFLIFGVFITAWDYQNTHTETITVTDKSVYPGQREKWLIYTKNEVYCIQDLFYAGFFSSSDVYNAIQIGETYEVLVSGARWPLISKYKNIRAVKRK